MEEAKRQVQDVLQEQESKPESQSKEEHRKHMNGLKPQINNLLHTYLPEDTTLKESDALAMVINDMIWNPQNYLTPKE